MGLLIDSICVHVCVITESCKTDLISMRKLRLQREKKTRESQSQQINVG